MSTFISEPGTRLGGRYRLEDRVAAAAGWAAWKAIDETLARAVTVVTFASGFPRVQEVLTAARAASRMTDARLAQVFDVEDDWDNAYIVMEWAAGETLGDMLASGPVEPIAGARIIAEAAAALSVAHAAGLAHLCLTPDSLRWTSGGGVKVTGIGVDAALSGTTAEDPGLADTHGLGRLLYASMTGMWPGADYPALPPAPFTDGHPRRPRQVRAGVPAVLDDVTCQAMQVPGRDGTVLTSPGQLAGALAAELPPEEVPPAVAPRPAPPSRSAADDDYWASGRGSSQAPPTRPSRRDWQPPRQQRGSSTGVKVAVVGALVLVVIIGVAAATTSFWHKTGPPTPTTSARAHHHVTTPQLATLTPVAAHGFDPLNLRDGSDENTNQAINVITHSPVGWSSQQYDTAKLGGLKAGTGLILDMGQTVRLSSVTIKFGASIGADVELKLGTSNVRSAQNLDTMVTVAAENNIGNTVTFPVNSKATGRYLVIWFTRMPPAGNGQFMGQVFAVSAKGTVVSS
jgi:serine/threonine protein kinase